jgi:hypothetical protein
MYPEAEFMNVNFVLRLLAIILRILRLEVSTFAQGEGGVKSVSTGDYE